MHVSISERLTLWWINRKHHGLPLNEMITAPNLQVKTDRRGGNGGRRGSGGGGLRGGGVRAAAERAVACAAAAAADQRQWRLGRARLGIRPPARPFPFLYGVPSLPRA